MTPSGSLKKITEPIEPGQTKAEQSLITHEHLNNKHKNIKWLLSKLKTSKSIPGLNRVKDNNGLMKKNTS